MSLLTTKHSSFPVLWRRRANHADAAAKVLGVARPNRAQAGEPVVRANAFFFLSFFFFFSLLTALQAHQRHLAAMWCEGVVVGFITRATATATLANRRVGAFLVRFSVKVSANVHVNMRARVRAVASNSLSSSSTLASLRSAIEPIRKFAIMPSSPTVVPAAYRASSPPRIQRTRAAAPRHCAVPSGRLHFGQRQRLALHRHGRWRSCRRRAASFCPNLVLCFLSSSRQSDTTAAKQQHTDTADEPLIERDVRGVLRPFSSLKVGWCCGGRSTFGQPRARQADEPLPSGYERSISSKMDAVKLND